MKKLILIDDHKMLRKGISFYITENSDWTILAEAEGLDEIPAIIKKIGSAEEDNIVAVVDIQIKGNADYAYNGFEAVKKLAAVGVPSVIFSSHDSGGFIERAMSADVGAKGFVSKLSDEKMLLDAINAVAAGKTFVQPDLVSSLMEMNSLFSILTKREVQVVKLIQNSGHEIGCHSHIHTWMNKMSEIEAKEDTRVAVNIDEVNERLSKEIVPEGIKLRKQVDEIIASL